jgi:capsular exopolysaccharide synthesis family protein
LNELSTWRHRLASREESQSDSSRVSDSDEIVLSQYWNILLKRRNIILPIFFTVFAAGAYFALSATTLYTGTAKIKIEPQTPRVTGVGELQPIGLHGEYDYYQTQFALLRSRALAARVITELDLKKDQAFTNAVVVTPNPLQHVKSWILRPLRLVASLMAPSSADPKVDQTGAGNQPLASEQDEPEISVSPDLIDRYLGFLGVEPLRQTRLVSVQFTTPDPALSQALANGHVQSFMRMTEENRFSLTEGAARFLDQKKTEIQKKVESSEAELNKFERAHGVVSIGKGQSIIIDRLVDLNKQLTAARTQRIEAESLYRTVENRSYQDLSEVMRQGLVQQLKGNVATLEAEKAKLATIFKPDHPRVQQLSEQIKAASHALSTEVANVVRGIRSNYAAALAKERALENEAEKQQRDALKLRELGVQYTLLQEEVNANRSLYESVLKRLSETSVVNDVAVSNMQIVEKAARPSRPSGPNVSMYLLAGMVSGLLLGVGVAFLCEFFDSTVGTAEDVWHSVGLGTLGIVPNLKSLNGSKYGRWQISDRKEPARLPAGKERTKELITEHGPLSIMTEAYRTIRTLLLLSQADKPPQVILLTSPSPGEGKTVTSLNLGIALALDGHSVLLIDADMRKGCCHTRLDLNNNRGLSNVLTGGLSLDRGIQETTINGLSLFSRGIPPPNPTELLGSRKMKDVLKELRERFEFILIDSPPVIAISDAAILSVISDGVLLVFDSQNTSTAYAQKAVERLDTVRARLLGVILNKVPLENPEYSYYQTYSDYYQPSEQHEHMRESSAWESDERTPDLDIAATGENGQEDGSRVNEPNNGGTPPGAKQTFADNPAQSVENGNPREINEDVSSRASPASRARTAGKRVARNKSAEAVSAAFLERLIYVFVEAVGPLGPLIVRDKISFLGESQDAFPKSRIDELVKSIEPDILHPEIRGRFRKKIAKEIQNLERPERS